MRYVNDYGTLKVKVKTGDFLYGRFTLDSDAAVLEAWVYFDSDESKGTVEVQSSDCGHFGFRFDPVRGTAFGAYHDFGVKQLTETPLFHAARLLLMHLKRNPGLRVSHLFEGVLLSIVLGGPLIVRQGEEFGAGELQSALFKHYMEDGIFDRCCMAPRVSTRFESWFFFDKIKEMMAGFAEGVSSATVAATPRGVQVQRGGLPGLQPVFGV